VVKGAGGVPRDASAPLSAPAAAQAAAASKAVASTSDAAHEGLLKITAPLLGTFYRRPQPGAPLYVEEGARVDEDTTVALIEVMKLFNPVKAGVKGTIERICAQNNDLVEYGQVLFLVRPD
jgi:acetyl-CoA carboxylase biotin carboxyl carrier protein